MRSQILESPDNVLQSDGTGLSYGVVLSDTSFQLASRGFVPVLDIRKNILANVHLLLLIGICVSVYYKHHNRMISLSNLKLFPT